MAHPGIEPQEPGGRRPDHWSGVLLASLDRACNIVIIVMLAAVLFFTIGQVVDRHFIRGAIYFQAYDQLARLALVWLTFVGIAVCFRDGTNIRVDLFEALFPGPLRIWRNVGMDAAVIVLSLYLNYKGWRLIEVGAYQAILGTPFTYVLAYAALLAGTALVSIFLAARIVTSLARLRAS